MEGASASTSSAAGPPSEANYPISSEEDSLARHCAITASQTPVATGSEGTPPAMLLPLSTSTELTTKDAKSHGTKCEQEIGENELSSPRLRSTRAFKGKDLELVCAEEKKKPLQLLDLPVDILKDIVKEVTHTNDLTSLALCHSALHRLTIPHIYSRFDIVWPDTNTHAEPRSGVDALTYGLATLVMAEEVFGEAPEQRQATSNRFNAGKAGKASEMAVRRRRGNHYAQFTRKFSLGNGPTEWVQEYLITKEGGKMLGTLVALAVARMRALETFIWDMPTGILRDVWLALSSLGDRDDDRPCRLEKVWVRWHDNNSSPDAQQPPPPPLNLNITLPSAPPPPLHLSGHMHSSSITQSNVHPAALDRVEHPSFSVLPALKSLSVLDVDELPYLDEMAVLIGRSLDKLRELRIGISRQAMDKDWVTVWEGETLEQIDTDYPTASSLTIGEKRLGGILGILTGLVCDMRKPQVNLSDRLKRRSQGYTPASPKTPAQVRGTTSATASPAPVMEPSALLSSITSLRDVLPDVSPPPPLAESVLSPEAQSIFGGDSAFENDPLVAQSSAHSSPIRTPASEPQEPVSPPKIEEEEIHRVESIEAEPEIEYLDNTLSLESLELERVPLSVPVLQRSIDWTRLTSLTLLYCHNHEQLWKTLRRNFAPTPKSPSYSHPRRTPNTTPRKGGRASIGGGDVELEYALKLKKIHTNTVSPALISFLKDTLAPNSLEVLFLQETRSYSSSVTVDQIFKGPLRRHRNSLKKLLIDASERDHDGVLTNSMRWRRWMLGRDILAFICSGKMPALRELGMAVDYRDWHFFLQHLPSIPHLRSLSIPFIAEHVHGSNVDPRELALQIVDIVALRPEVELCYMGIANKCFEILENRRTNDTWDGGPDSRLGVNGGLDEDDDAAASEDDPDDDEEEVNEDDDPEVEDADTESDEDDADDEDTDSEMDGTTGAKGTARLRLREILFYDDKVAIFKARHGRL